MKKKLLMLLIGSMMLGMVGCANNKDDDSDKTTDSTKETKQEATTEPTVEEDEPTEAPKKEVTVEELLENMLNCDYNRTTYYINGSGKMVDDDSEIDAELTASIITYYDGDVEHEESVYKYEFDMDVYEEMLKKSFLDEGMPEEQWEQYFDAVIEMFGIEDGCMSEELEVYRYYKDDTLYFIEYDEFDDVWYEWEEEDHEGADADLAIIAKCCKEAELTADEDGYILSATVINDELMEALGLTTEDVEVEINIWFDTDGNFDNFDITILDIEDDDFVFDSLVMTCIFRNDFDEEIVLPSNIETF